MLFAVGCRAQDSPSSTSTMDSTGVPAISNPSSANEAVRVEGWTGINNLFREGDTYFSGQPDEASWRAFIAESGVETVVVLRAEEELAGLPFDQPALLEELGVTVVHVPISPDTFSKSDTEALGAALQTANGPVLVQCGSSNRSGALWAAYLAIEEGVALEEALERGRAAGLRGDAMTEAVRRVVSGS